MAAVFIASKRAKDKFIKKKYAENPILQKSIDIYLWVIYNIAIRYIFT
jgi:hypothetical protein